jgi:hypothetical protein
MSPFWKYKTCRNILPSIGGNILKRNELFLKRNMEARSEKRGCREKGKLCCKGGEGSAQRLDRFWGAHNLISNGYWGSFPGVKRLDREADHSLPPSAEVKNRVALRALPNISSWRGV